MSSRREFVKQALMGTAVLGAPALNIFAEPGTDLKISLAEWSLHRTINAGKLDHLDFPATAKNKFGISTVEYVNTFFGGNKMNFKEAATNTDYLNDLLSRSRDVNVVNHLLMVDDEGPLAIPDDSQRLEAVDNHKKWIDAAKILGCRTVRVNLHGEGSPEEKEMASIDSLSRLGEYAKPMQVNVVVENHGHESSNGAWIANIMEQVAMENVGTLPDFGNFCLTQAWGSTQEDCEKMYDRYKGVKEMLPYAKGVSAKTYDFDANGEQPLMDYKRLLDIVKDSGFKGYIGVEFEGNTQPEEEGIRKTKLLLEKYL